MEELKEQMKKIDTFIELMKAQINFYNLTCVPGYELTIDQVLEYLKNQKTKV